MRDSKRLDLDFRPKYVFGPGRLEAYLLTKMEGAAVKGHLQVRFEAGRHARPSDEV